MKILFINRMMGISWGGGENYDYHLARGLQKRGHEVIMLTGSATDHEFRPPQGIECVPLAGPYLRKYMYRLAGRLPLVPGLFAELDLKIFIERAKGEIDRLIKDRRIDVAQVLALPYLASWLEGRVPTAMRFPGPPAWFQSSVLRRLGRNRRVGLFTHGDAVRYFRNRLSTNVREVSPGIDRSVFRPPTAAERDQARHALGFARTDFVVATVGRLIEGKGHEFALRALSGLPDARIKLLVVGDGPRRKSYERIAADYGLRDRVVFAGRADAQGVAWHLWASDLFCLLSSYENYSNAALEAMSAGLPVVASRIGGFPQQVTEGKNGFLITLGDDLTLRDHFRALAAGPELRRTMSAHAISFASRFSWDAASESVEEMYEQIRA